MEHSHHGRFGYHESGSGMGDVLTFQSSVGAQCNLKCFKATRDVSQSKIYQSGNKLPQSKNSKAARDSPHSKSTGTCHIEVWLLYSIVFENTSKRTEFLPRNFRMFLRNLTHSLSLGRNCGVRDESPALIPRTQVRGKNE